MQKRRNKRTSRPTDGLVIRHEASGGATRWLVLALLPITIASAALAYRLYMDQSALKDQLAEIPAIQASKAQMADALTTERLRGDALEKELIEQKRLADQAQAEIGELRNQLAQVPEPSFDAQLSPGGLELTSIDVKPTDDAKKFEIALSVSRMVSADGLPEIGSRHLGHLEVKKAEKPIVGNVRVVVVPEDEGNGKRVYLPQKSWRRSEGFQYSLSTGHHANFKGEVELPDGFDGGTARIEIFVNHSSGGYTLLRRVIPWPES